MSSRLPDVPDDWQETYELPEDVAERIFGDDHTGVREVEPEATLAERERILDEYDDVASGRHRNYRIHPIDPETGLAVCHGQHAVDTATWSRCPADSYYPEHVEIGRHCLRIVRQRWRDESGVDDRLADLPGADHVVVASRSDLDKTTGRVRIHNRDDNCGCLPDQAKALTVHEAAHGHRLQPCRACPWPPAVQRYLVQRRLAEVEAIHDGGP